MHPNQLLHVEKVKKKNVALKHTDLSNLKSVVILFLLRLLYWNDEYNKLKLISVKCNCITICTERKNRLWLRQMTVVVATCGLL